MAWHGGRIGVRLLQARKLTRVAEQAPEQPSPHPAHPVPTHVPLPQVLTYGHRKPVAEFVGEIRALSLADLKAAVGKLLKSPPSMAVLGDIAHVPRYDQVAKRFG